MTQKRLAALFGAVLLAFSVVMGRLYLLAQNQEYAQTAQAQTVTNIAIHNSTANNRFRLIPIESTFLFQKICTNYSMPHVSCQAT